MVIKKITFCNILTYYGEQTIELPIAGERTLTILVGPNNSGKTSIIRALKFWFYGRDGIADRKDPVSYISNRAKAETPIGKSLEAWVEITFERQVKDDRETKTLRRVIEAKRTAESRWELRSTGFFVSRPTERIPLIADVENRFQRIIESMVPKALFDAFYFKGEPLDGKLLGDVGGIRSALGQFLHEDQWEEAQDAVGEIRDNLSKKLAKLTSANSELKNKLNELSQWEIKLEAQRKALSDEESSLEASQALHLEETQKLESLGDEEAARSIRTKLSSAQQRFKAAESQLRSVEESLKSEISNSLGIPFLVSTLAPVSRMLKEMEDDNILPADITDGFVDRVLSKKSCICGKPHDSSSRSHWEAYKAKTLNADAGAGLRKLLDWVKPQGTLSIKSRSKEISKNIARLVNERLDAITAKNEADTEIKALQSHMENIPIEEIARIGKSLRVLSEQIRSKENRARTISDALRITEYNTKNLKSEIQEVSKKSGVDQNAFKKLTTSKDKADRLHKALTECRSRLGLYFHRNLQSNVSSIYDSKSTDGSKAHIHRQTLLPAIHVHGQATRELGGGQSQLLALAYVVSLAKLRQSMHEQLEELDIRLGRIDDLSFFMDSPFGHMEEHYKRAAVELVPHCARQMFVFVWKEEWDFVRPLLEKKADAIYAIEFATSRDDLDKVDKPQRKYAFSSGSKELLVSLPKGEMYPHSTILKIK